MVGHLTLLVDPGQQGDIVCKYPPRHPKSTKISGFFTFDNKTQCLYYRKKKLTAQHCARNLAVSRPQKVWGLTFARTWGEGRHPQVSFSALHLTFLKLETWFFCIAAFLSFLSVHWKFQVSVAFGFGDMTLFFRSCHVLNDEYPISCDGYGPCELLTRWFRLFLPVLPPTYHWTCCSAMYRCQGQGQGQPRSSKIIAL